MRWPFSTDRSLVGLLIVLAALHLTWIAAGAWPVEVLPLVGNLSALPAWFLATLLCFRAARRHQRQVRRAWWFMGAGALAWFAAQVMYTLLYALHWRLFPSVADVAYLLVIPFTAAGVLALRREAEGPLQGASFVIDIALAVLVLGETLWHLYLREVMTGYAGQPLAGVIAFSYPLMDLLLCGLLLVLLLWRPRDLSGRQVLALMVGGGFYLTADLIYAYQAAHDVYAPGSWIDVGWNLYATCLGIAASSHLGPSRRPEAVQRRLRRFRSIAPQLTGSAVFVFYALFVASRHEGWALLVVLTALFLARQVLSLLDARRLTRELSRQAEHDFLTGLFNRVQLEESLRETIEDAVQHQRSAALLFIDLDHMKQINDTFGHPTGDAVLCEVALRLTRVLNGQGPLARFGGDEFVAILPNGRPGPALETLVERLLAELSQPVRVGREWLGVTASVGVALCPQDALTPGQALAQADAAMYRAKQAGKSTWRYVDERLNERWQGDLQIGTLLRGALERGEFELHYQPLVRLHDGALMGFEALLRWTSPQLGPVAPDVFIPVAEERGMLPGLGTWVLEVAARQVQAWRGSRWPHLYVSVNVSASQFEAADFVPRLSALLAELGLPGEALMLELTERTLIHDVTSSACRIREVQALGVRLALDDFGTGYSSLSILQEMPVDVLKIDRTFVRHLDSRGAAFIQAMLTLARHLNMTVIAEGIEERCQLDRLRQLECDLGQGYHFARPAPAGQVVQEGWSLD